VVDNAADPELVDAARIAELRELLGEDLREVLSEFLNTAPAHLAVLTTTATDPAALIPALHALRGGAGNIGLVRLAEECRLVEERLRARDAIELDGALRQITHTFVQTQDVIRRLR